MNLKPLWTPSADQIRQANLTAFIHQIQREETRAVAGGVSDYRSLYQWSIDQPAAFWRAVWRFCEVQAECQGSRTIASAPLFHQRRFFPDARLNYAENLLGPRGKDPVQVGRGDQAAVIFWGEDQVKRSLSFRELAQEVSQVAGALKKLGVQRGDRVAGFIPNLPEALVAFLATASLGAIWASCSPDFGVAGALDRLGQLEPKVLFVGDHSIYQGKRFSCRDKVKELQAQLPSVQVIVEVPYGGEREEAGVFGGRSWVNYAAFRATHSGGTLDFVQVPFDHPLMVLFSSGTTGKPKGIVHGHGGTLVQHLKEHQLHCDVKPGDRLFYFTTTGWMMWNWLVSGLASGATLLLYDGAPLAGNGQILFDYAQAERMTLFGTSAKYIDALRKEKACPQKTHDLGSVRMICSTGSPLMPESFDYVYQNISATACLASISGGTDIVSCFALGNPVGPVWRGELQTRGLGMKVEMFDEQGHPLHNQKGELVCTAPFPSMPVEFWADPGDERYLHAYFRRFEGVWHHGDYGALTEHGGMIIYGRSDAVLNPGGVRIGTAEIYRQVDQIDGVLESLAVGQEWEGDTRVILFVKLRSGHRLDEPLKQAILHQIRVNTSPRHVPAKIIQIAEIPRTLNGKPVELAVHAVIHGRAVKNREALANPEVLELYQDLPELRV